MNSEEEKKLNDCLQIREEDKDSVKKFKTVCARLIDVFERKNRNYGDSVYTVPILAGNVDVRTSILVRMSDKINRMHTLSQGAEDEVSESFEDTMLDLVNYGIIWMTAAEEKKRPEYTEPNLLEPAIEALMQENSQLLHTERARAARPQLSNMTKREIEY